MERMKELALGGTGRTVRDNVKRLRGGMQYKELSQRLESLGHPIPALGLRRIESGARRVSVDDLVALAVALDVSPLTLLLPADGSQFAFSPMTGVPDRPVAHNVQWLWAAAEEPLELDGDDVTGHEVQRTRFRARSKPMVEGRITTWPTDWSIGDDAEHSSAPLLRVAFAQGVKLDELRTMTKDERAAYGLTGEEWGDAPDGDD